MKLLQALKMADALLKNVKLTQEPLLDGSLIQYDTDEISEGDVIYLCDGANDWSVLPDGLYQTKSGIKFTITDGIVTDINTDSYVKPTPVPNPKPQLINNSVDTLDDNKPGENNGKAEGVYINGTPGDAQKELDEAMSEDAKDDGGKPKYGNVEYADSGLQSDKKKRYPIDTEEHIRAAWNYINKEKNANLYSPENLKKVKDKIIAAWKEKIEKAGPPSVQKNSMEKSPELIAAELKLAEAQAEVTKLTTAIKEPGAGAPADLLHPDDPVTQDDFSKLKADHATLSEAHTALCGKYDEMASQLGDVAKKTADIQLAADDIAKKHKELSDKFDDMAKESKKKDEKMAAAEKQIILLSKLPAGTLIEEVKQSNVVIDDKLKNSPAYQILSKR